MLSVGYDLEGMSGVKHVGIEVVTSNISAG